MIVHLADTTFCNSDDTPELHDPFGNISDWLYKDDIQTEQETINSDPAL